MWKVLFQTDAGAQYQKEFPNKIEARFEYDIQCQVGSRGGNEYVMLIDPNGNYEDTWGT